MYVIERMMLSFWNVSQLRFSKEYFKVDGNILCGLSDGEKEKTLPKVSPFIV